jgi:molybdate transport system substrate-binding protein
MKPRIVIETRPGGSVTAVVEGKAELGFALVSEIVPVPEVKLVGPVPGDLQTYTVFAAGVSSNTKDAPAARSFVEFLRGAGARSTFSAKGMEGM